MFVCSFFFLVVWLFVCLFVCSFVGVVVGVLLGPLWFAHSLFLLVGIWCLVFVLIGGHSLCSDVWAKPRR